MDEKQVIGLAAWVIPLVVVLVGVYAMITGEISLGGHMYTHYHGTTARLMGAAAVIAAVYIRLELATRIDEEYTHVLGLPVSLVKISTIVTACILGSIASFI